MTEILKKLNIVLLLLCVGCSKNRTLYYLEKTEFDINAKVIDGINNDGDAIKIKYEDDSSKKLIKIAAVERSYNPSIKIAKIKGVRQEYKVPYMIDFFQTDPLKIKGYSKLQEAEKKLENDKGTMYAYKSYFGDKRLRSGNFTAKYTNSMDYYKALYPKYDNSFNYEEYPALKFNYLAPFALPFAAIGDAFSFIFPGGGNGEPIAYEPLQKGRFWGRKRKSSLDCVITVYKNHPSKSLLFTYDHVKKSDLAIEKPISDDEILLSTKDNFIFLSSDDQKSGSGFSKKNTVDYKLLNKIGLKSYDDTIKVDFKSYDGDLYSRNINQTIISLYKNIRSVCPYIEEQNTSAQERQIKDLFSADSGLYEEIGIKKNDLEVIKQVDGVEIYGLKEDSIKKYFPSFKNKSKKINFTGLNLEELYNKITKNYNWSRNITVQLLDERSRKPLDNSVRFTLKEIDDDLVNKSYIENKYLSLFKDNVIKTNLSAYIDRNVKENGVIKNEGPIKQFITKNQTVRFKAIASHPDYLPMEQLVSISKNDGANVSKNIYMTKTSSIFNGIENKYKDIEIVALDSLSRTPIYGVNLKVTDIDDDLFNKKYVEELYIDKYRNSNTRKALLDYINQSSFERKYLDNSEESSSKIYNNNRKFRLKKYRNVVFSLEARHSNYMFHDAIIRLNPSRLKEGRVEILLNKIGSINRDSSRVPDKSKVEIK